MTALYVRSEYRSTFGREHLTIWSPPFASTFEADAHELPHRDGYMVTTYNGDRVRVECPTPRTEDNYETVDAALVSALSDHYDAVGAHTVAEVLAGA